MLTLRLHLLMPIMAMLCCSVPASASDRALNVYADHVGRLNGWILLPEVVLKHCEIHLPGKKVEMQAAFESWRTTHRVIIDAARSAIDETAPVFAPLLGMTVEQAKAWQNDSSTLVIEEVTFWRKGRMEIYGTCQNYPSFLLEQHSSETTLARIRQSIMEIKRAKGQ